MKWIEAEKVFAEKKPGYEPRPQQRLAATAIEDGLAARAVTIVQAGTGVGKALALDTPVPTPSGWTAMGALRVGDEVFDETGTMTRITTVFDVLIDRDCFSVEFSDGTNIVADADHEWVSYTCQDRKRALARKLDRAKGAKSRSGRCKPDYSTVTTRQMRDTLRVSPNDRLNHAVRVAGSLALPEQDLPIAPYTLGAWLGDGTAWSSRITSIDPEILAHVAAEGYTVSQGYPNTVSSALSYAVDGLTSQLRRIGLLRTESKANGGQRKFIPAQYLRASDAQRRTLLAGLLDTDGTVSAGGCVEFDSTEERLARETLELVRTLGYRPTLTKGPATLDGIEHGVVYTVRFTTTDEVFRLARKREVHALRDRNPSDARRAYRYVTGVRPVDSVPVRCIQVEADSHLYLAGEAMIPTHNSFANLVPAIEYSFETGEPVIVSTATKALQSQYANTDLPYLQKTLGEDFSFAVVKGRGSFVCHQKLKELTPSDVDRIEQLRAEVAEPGHTGDLDDVATPLQPFERGRVTTGSEECPGARDCPFGDVCFAERAKARAHTANIVIVNHAALVADLKIKQMTGGQGGILPDAAAVIIDESHELGNYATNTLGGELTHRGIRNLAGEVANLTGPAGAPAVGAAIHAAEQLFGHLGGLVRRERTVKLSDEAVLDAEAVIGDFMAAMEGLHRSVLNFPVHGDDGAKQKRKRLMKKTQAMSGKFTEIVLADSEDMVRWVESERGRDGKDHVKLKYAPLHVGPFLREMLWDRMPAVLSSATVAIGDDFSFVAEQHGIREYRSVDAGTPFDYPKQARLFVPKGCVPDAGGRANWEVQMQIVGDELIPAAGGRTLLLFSSRQSMNNAHRALSPMLHKRGYTVLKQGDGTTRELSARFKEDESSVLFGLASFGTGFDVQGDALRLVIIDKMPFPVPTDVIFKARCEVVDKHATGWNDGAFMKLSVPMMALSLLQWAGRLIRSKSDEGLLVIMDSRLDTKGYGKKVRAALPDAGRLVGLSEAKGYLEELSSRRD